MKEILEFINRRFQEDCSWVNGNCYYFAIILQSRFLEGEIFYDTKSGHFVFKYQDRYYDWSGLYHYNDSNLISWKEFDMYDSLQKKRIIRDCIL